MVDERWLPAPGFEGYEASDLGRVRSLDRVIVDSLGRERFHAGQVLSLSVDPKGYQFVSIARVPVRVHVLVMLAFVGPPPPDHEVCHGPGGKLDNRLVNLRYDTPSENQRDSVSDGTHRNARKTICPGSHLLVAPNLVASELPRRKCLSCNRARSRGISARRAGRPFDLQAVADEIYVSLGFAVEAE